MKIVEQKSRRAETVIGICLLAVLVFIATAVVSRQFDYDMSRYGIVQPKAEFELRSAAPTGFETLSTTESYSPGTLYEKINGKAPLYLDSGFGSLQTQRFMNSSDETLWMEVYLFDMGEIKNAFSVFSVQRREDAQPFGSVPITFGYKTSNGLYFVHGKYNVEMVGSQASESLVAGMEAVAATLQNGLSISDEQISELGIFEGAGFANGSIKFELNSAFGYEGLNNTFSTKYQSGEENVTVFFSKRRDEQQAEKLFNSYYDFLITNGFKDVGADFCGANGKVVDYYGFKEVIFHDGVYVGGVHEAENQQAAIQAALVLKEKIGGGK